MYTPTIPCRVSCPADRGDPAYVGTATSVSETIEHNHLGEPYRWVTVTHPNGRSTIWPSNRLSAA